MAIESTSAASGVGAKVDAGRTRLAENFEMFLTLLTTQLQNQDPLAPMDANQFTQQLVQMTSVEQQLLSNELLQKIADRGTESDFQQAVGMIGHGVTVRSPDATLGPDGAGWTYELPTAATKVTVQVRDSTGKLLFEDDDAAYSAGRHDIEWDGKIDGVQAPIGGVYTMSVSATDANGKAVASNVYTDGLVTGVEQKADGVYVSVGRSSVKMDRIASVWLAVASQSPSGGAAN